MTKDKKLEVVCLREYDDKTQRINEKDLGKLLKKKKLRMPTMEDLFWIWKQGTKIESKYRPFWIKMPAGSAVPGYYYYFGDYDRFNANLGYVSYGDDGRFGGVGVRDVEVKP